MDIVKFMPGDIGLTAITKEIVEIGQADCLGRVSIAGNDGSPRYLGPGRGATLIDGIPLNDAVLKSLGFDVSDKEVKKFTFGEAGNKMSFSLRQMYDRRGQKKGYSFIGGGLVFLVDYLHQLQQICRIGDIPIKVSVESIEKEVVK